MDSVNRTASRNVHPLDLECAKSKYSTKISQHIFYHAANAALSNVSCSIAPVMHNAPLGVDAYNVKLDREALCTLGTLVEIFTVCPSIPSIDDHNDHCHSTALPKWKTGLNMVR